jgi:tetratricopeptide (TPR) repeat protein
MNINSFSAVLSLKRHNVPSRNPAAIAAASMLFLLLAQFCFAANDYQTQINNAEENFKNGNFAASAAIYESLINVEKVNNPFIYYNLSNAYFRNGNLGNAVLNIERAYRLKPRDADIKNNRRYLRALAGEKKDFLRDFFSGTFSLNEISGFCAALIVLVFLLLSAGSFKKSAAVNKAVIAAAILMFPALLWTSYKIKTEIINDKAVALKTLTARSGPGENNPEIFEVKEGKTAEIISENAGWSNITITADGELLAGWAETKNIEKINR